MAQGASAAAVVETASIVVDEGLADLCRPPGCPNYGLGASCPPHVGGPAAFRRRLAGYRKALLFRIDVPRSMLLDNARREVFVTLHRLAACIETAAVERGCRDARAYAGGACKMLFCADYVDCPVIANTGTCRWPDQARPSMSGYGIDVFRLMDDAGWPRDPTDDAGNPGREPLSTVVGLVLVC